jgi:hypothetical protein
MAELVKPCDIAGISFSAAAPDRGDLHRLEFRRDVVGEESAQWRIPLSRLQVEISSPL